LSEFEVSRLSVELELLDELSFFAQDMMVTLKNIDRERNKIFFIFSSIPKLKYYWLREPLIYQNWGVIYKNRGFYLGSTSVLLVGSLFYTG
jgi:hypothetical protein